LERVPDRVDRFLKDDLLRGVLELLTGEPAPMRHRPMAAAAINPAVPQQERKKLLALTPKVVSRRLASARKIVHRLMRRIWRPYSSQFAGLMQPRQCDRIPPVGLNPLARSFRNQRRSDHYAAMPERLRLAIDSVSRRPSFEADMQPVVSVSQSFDRPLDRQGAVLNIAHKSNFPGSATLRDRHGVRLLGDIESH